MTVSMIDHWDPLAARTAGGLYIAIAICGGFSIGYFPMQIVTGDVTTSSANLLANQGLFKLGVLADCVVILFELAITAILFHMFHPAGPKMATLALISRASMIAIMGINVLLWVMPYGLLTGQSGLDPSQLNALIQFSFAAHSAGVYVWQLFFGVHLLALGWLILKSDVVPNLLGRGLFIGAFGYIIQGIVELIFADVALLDYCTIGLLVIVTISEIGFGLWLVISGGRIAPRFLPETA